MQYARSLILPATPASLASLLKDPPIKGAQPLILQCAAGNAANANFGSSSEQPAFIVPGGSAELRESALKDVYVSGNGSDTMAVLVL